MISKTQKKSGKKKYTTSYGSYAGFFITVTIIILLLAYLVDNGLKMNSSQLDILTTTSTTNTFESSMDAYIQTRDRHFFFPILRFYQFGDGEPGEFDVYR